MKVLHTAAILLLLKWTSCNECRDGPCNCDSFKHLCEEKPKMMETLCPKTCGFCPEDGSAVDENPKIIDGSVVNENPKIIDGSVVDENPKIIDGSAVDENPKIIDGSAVDENPKIIDGSAVDENPKIIYGSAVDEDPKIVDGSGPLSSKHQDSKIIDGSGPLISSLDDLKLNYGVEPESSHMCEVTGDHFYIYNCFLHACCNGKMIMESLESTGCKMGSEEFKCKNLVKEKIMSNSELGEQIKIPYQ